VLAIDVNKTLGGIVREYLRVYFASIPCAECVVVAVEYLLPVKTVAMLACLVNLVVSSSVPLDRDSR
jgi:hypothetical protein